MQDELDQVLETCKEPQIALSASPDVLYHSLRCAICNSLMLEPYTVNCGHTFCGGCLRSWSNLSRRGAAPTCPTCRKPYSSEPSLTLALREIALVVAASYAVEHPSAHIDLELKNTGDRFLKKIVPPPKYDSDDDVYRCVECSHEVEEDGYCSGCGQFYPTMVDETAPEDSSDDENNTRHDSSRRDGFTPADPIDLFGDSSGDPWRPVPQLEESFDDVWDLFIEFMKKVREVNSNYLRTETSTNRPPFAGTYRVMGVDPKVASGRFLLLNWRWWDWSRRWNRMVKDAARAGVSLSDPFLDNGRYSNNIKEGFRRFLDLVHQKRIYKELNASFGPERVQSWEWIYGIDQSNEVVELDLDSEEDGDVVNLIDDYDDDDSDNNDDEEGDGIEIGTRDYDDDEDDEDDDEEGDSMDDFIEDDENEEDDGDAAVDIDDDDEYSDSNDTDLRKNFDDGSSGDLSVDEDEVSAPKRVRRAIDDSDSD